MNSKFKILLILLILTSSCQKREWNNPFDANCPKEIFTPYNFNAEQQGNTIKLTWEQANTNISGFIINRNENDGLMTEASKIGRSVTIWNDNNVVGGKKYGYQLVAYAGNNLSNPRSVYLTPVFGSTVTTSAAASITSNSAVLGGNVVNDGGAAITGRGICYSISQNPTTSNNMVAMGSGTGSFSNTVTGLAANTTYYVKAYAINSQGTSYGIQVSFTTTQALALASATTADATTITTTSAVLGGTVTGDGGAAVTERGICYSTSQNPTTASNKMAMGSGTGSFSNTVTGLSSNTTYYVRTYAINSQGTAYGTQVSFTTSDVAPVVPTLTTTAVTAITQTTATSGGNITSDGGAFVTIRGVCWNTSVNPTIALSTKTTNGTGTGSFVSNLISLQPGTIYYVKSYATNSIGTSYGNEISFTTLQQPTATTEAASSLASTTATLNGTVNANNQSTTVTFEYGTTTSYGQTINAIPNTVSGSTNTSVSANLTGLTTSTMYHYRVKAVSSGGTTYGSDVTFTCGIIFNPNLTYGSVYDNDGNTYKTILIGTQTWMAENLKTIKYNDGTAIPLVTDGAAWAALITPGYCWYNNDAATYKATYGTLYNWYTVNTGKLCPTGWHVPSDAELTTLTYYLEGVNVVGGKLKEIGITHWLSPNSGATNETGFTALPGGYRRDDGIFMSIRYDGHWWSSTESSARSNAGCWSIYYSTSDVFSCSGSKPLGFSVRCLRDI